MAIIDRMYQISPVYARVVLRQLLAQGLPPEACLQGTGLRSKDLQQADALTLQDFQTILDNAAALPGGDTIGLVIGRHSHTLSLGAIGAAIGAAPTLGDGLRAMESFSRLHASYIRVSLAADLQGLSCQVHYLQELGASRRFHSESAVLLMQNHVEAVTGEALEDAHYAMDFPRRPYYDDPALPFHSPLSFDHEVCAIHLPRHRLEQPSPYFQGEIWQQGQRLLAQRIREQGNSGTLGYSEHLRALLRSHQPPLPGLEDMASELHLSARSLNRRLREEGTTFRDIRAGILDDWARLYLRESRLTVEAIAAELGYQDTANFRRAFRARAGCSPASFRDGDKR